MEENNENQVPNEPVVNNEPQNTNPTPNVEQPNPNPNPAPSGGSTKPPKKKKKMGAVRGLCLALLIVIVICAIALLVRMVIAEDGDYFKPIKQVFGLEEEKEVKKSKDDDEDDEVKASEEKETKKKGKKANISSYQLSKVVDEAYDEDVDHYRLAMNLKDLMEVYQEMEESGEADEILESLPALMDISNTNNSKPKAKRLANTSLDSSYDSDDALDTYGSMAESLLGNEEMMEMLDGEFYMDFFVRDNEIVQAVIGIDMLAFFDNLYDMAVESSPEMADEYDDGYALAEYVNDMILEMVTEDQIVDMLVENMEVEGMDFTQKQLRDMIDISFTPGVYEFYLNGTVALNDALENFLEENEEDMIESAEEQGIDYDGTNFFEVVFDLYNEALEDEGLGGFSFELVR